MSNYLGQLGPRIVRRARASLAIIRHDKPDTAEAAAKPPPRKAPRSAYAPWRGLRYLLALGVVVACHPSGSEHGPHRGFPAVPNGLTAIINTFGQPCNASANKERHVARANDTGESYLVVYHDKLGPGPTHISNAGTSPWWHVAHSAPGQLKHGIFGYNCRKIAGSNSWSTHAWGIAIDMNTVPNHSWLRHCHIHDLGDALRNAFTSHNWKEISCDAGHLQYATGY